MVCGKWFRGNAQLGFKLLISHKERNIFALFFNLDGPAFFKSMASKNVDRLYFIWFISVTEIVIFAIIQISFSATRIF